MSSEPSSPPPNLSHTSYTNNSKRYKEGLSLPILSRHSHSPTASPHFSYPLYPNAASLSRHKRPLLAQPSSPFFFTPILPILPITLLQLSLLFLELPSHPQYHHVSTFIPPLLHLILTPSLSSLSQDIWTL